MKGFLRAGCASLAAILFVGCSGVGAIPNSVASRGGAHDSGPASGDRFRVLYRFRGGRDGSNPDSTVLPDGGGALLGVTTTGGSGCRVQEGNYFQIGCGTVFELVPSGSGYIEYVIHQFDEGPDGSDPYQLVRGKGRRFYGVTSYTWKGGCGSIFEVRSVANGSGERATYKTIYRFQGPDGCGLSSSLVLASGAIYGTTEGGGAHDKGTVFKLTRSATGYTESVLYSFRGSDGNDPTGTLSADSSGNLYGATLLGGRFGNGVVFKLTKSRSGYNESVIHEFSGADGVPFDGIILDRRGDAIGTTGATSCGVVFSLVPTSAGYRYTILHQFTTDACGPDGLVISHAGAIFGTTEFGGSFSGSRCAGNGCGTVFELLPSTPRYKLVVLHKFDGRDGIQPVSGVTVVGKRLIGTAGRGGVRCHAKAGLGCGTVFSFKV
jgi:uncharacterized repeat protein (TIGR03803 family)